MSSEVVKKTADYVKLKLYGESTGHDWFHVQRVFQMARRLQVEEGGDLELIELCVLLHDLGDYKQYGFNEQKGSLVLHGMMDILEIDEDLQNRILKITAESQYNGEDTKAPSTIEGKIVQDADWLEALGAVGIARTFATGGVIHRVIHDPTRKPRQRLSKKDYQLRKTEGTSLNYFYEKALKLPKMMNTKTGKKIALERAKFIEDFVVEFLAECEGKK